MEQTRYCAFISYRHMSPDMEIAKRLHTLIENYTIPAGIRKDKGRKHPGKVFRDQEELPLSADLGKDIEAALDHSDWLICICSPRYPESRWCMRELEYFIEVHGRERVLTVLAEGEPADSFPALVSRVKREDGTEADIEPLAADVRGRDLKESLGKLRREKLRLLAPMLDTSYDGLYQRQRRRKTRRIVAGCAAVLAAAGAFLLYSGAQRQRIEEQRAVSVRNECDLLLEQGTTALGSSRKAEALRLAMEARSLSESIGGYRGEQILRVMSGACYAGDFSVETPLQIAKKLITGDSFSPDGRKIAGLMNENTLGCCDAETGALLWTDTCASAVSSYHWNSDSSRIVSTSQWAHTVRVLDAETGEVLHSLHAPWALNACFLGDEIHIVFEQGIMFWDPMRPEEENIPMLSVSVGQHASSQLFHEGRILAVLSSEGQPVFTIVDFPGDVWYDYTAPYFQMVNGYTVSPDGKRLFVHQYDKVYVCDPDSEEILWEQKPEKAVQMPSLEHFQDPLWHGDVIYDNVADGTIEVSYHVDAYDAGTGEKLFTIPDVQCLAVTEDGEYLLCWDGVYSAADGSLLTGFPGVLQAVDAGQEHYLIRGEKLNRSTALGKGTQYTAEKYTGTLYADRNDMHRIISPDDRYSVIPEPTGAGGFTILEMDGSNRQKRIYDFTPGWWVAFSPDSRLAALGTNTGTAAVYELETGKQVFYNADWMTRTDFKGFTFNRDGSWLMYADYSRIRFAVASMETGRVVYEMHALKPVTDWGFDEETGDATVVYEDGSALCATLFMKPEEVIAYAEKLSARESRTR